MAKLATEMARVGGSEGSGNKMASLATKMANLSMKPGQSDRRSEEDSDEEDSDEDSEEDSDEEEDETREEDESNDEEDSDEDERSSEESEEEVKSFFISEKNLSKVLKSQFDGCLDQIEEPVGRLGQKQRSTYSFNSR